MNTKGSEYLSEDLAMSGYLYKKTRDGRWQKRWYETNGVYLTYYKSRKMEKLLAALSLPQVGEIRLVPPEEDPEPQNGLFTLKLNTRIYTLRAKSDQEAQLWVNTLNKLRLDGMNPGSASTTGTSPPPPCTSSGETLEAVAFSVPRISFAVGRWRAEFLGGEVPCMLDGSFGAR